jgi:hypothetical protein
MVLPASTHLIRAIRALNRVARRIQDYQHSARPGSPAPTSIAGLQPRPPMLDGMTDNTAVCGALSTVLRAQEHLLAQLDGTLPFDPREAVWALQEIAGAGYEWSAPARRMAAALGVELRGLPCEAGRAVGVEVDTLVRQRAAVDAARAVRNSAANSPQPEKKQG